VKHAFSFGSSAVLGSFGGVLESGVAEEARTRGFAAPAFAGCALVEVDYSAGRYLGCQDRRTCRGGVRVAARPRPSEPGGVSYSAGFLRNKPN
jgi:hypothetical protein